MKSACLSIAALLFSALVASAQPAGPKIVGGSEIGRNEFPFGAWVKIRVGRDRPNCTGSVIAPRWVLTAAHCLAAEGGEILPAFVFEVLVDRDFSRAAPNLVQTVIVHPDYRNPVIYPDAALLELSQPVAVEPVGLLDLEGESLHASPGTQAVLIGGGLIEGGQAAGVLRKASFTISSDCPLRLVTESAMCINTTAGKEPKEGDSGGPLVVRLPNGKWAQAGITKASASAGFAPLTRVAAIHDWIDGHVPLDETTPPPPGPTPPPPGPTPAAVGTITTFAGTGEPGFSGDGGPAVQARLSRPGDIAVDGAGNLFIADRFNHRIRKVDSSGVITTIAGTGERGYSGDGGPAVQARLSRPSGIAVDGAGNLFIADLNNHRIRKVDSSGIITTVAGGTQGYGGDGGPAIEARLDVTPDVAVDAAGNLYIADFNNNRVRKVDSSGTISTLAGDGTHLIGGRGGIGDGGPAVSARLRAPEEVAADDAGNVYISDSHDQRVRKVDSSGTITTIAGSGESGFDRGGFRGDGGPADQARLNLPSGLAVDAAGNLFIADTQNHRIRKVDSSGVITTIAGSGDTGFDRGGFGGDGEPADQARLNVPVGLAVDAAGNLYISESSNHRIRVVKSKSLLTGDRIYYFPHLAVGASWQTTITLINYSPGEVSCQTDFLSDQATPLLISFPSLGPVDSRTDVLPPGGSVHEETDVGLSAPLAAGWARATCSGPVKAGLLFRQHDSAGIPVAEAGVNAASAAATRFVTFAEQAPGRTGTGVAYANPSGTEAVVTFTAKDTAGQTLASEDLTVLPAGHGAQNMASLFDLTSFSGSLEITSTKPIVTLSLNAEAAPVFSSLPPGEPDAAAQGPTTYYFPHLAAGASWQTTITYINDSSREVTCETEFISDHGTPLPVSFPGRGMLMDRTDVLPPGGSVHEETDVDLGAPLVPGWAKAACTGPVKASLLFRQYDSEGAPVAEAGVNAAAVPAKRFVTFAEQAEGKTGTGMAYANPSDTAAHVTFTAKDTAGQTLASVVRTLLPEGHDAHVMAGLFDFTNFTGSLEITSTAPIVSLSLNFEAAPVFSSLPPGEVEESAP